MPTPDEVRQSVARAYGTRVTPVLNHPDDELLPVTDAGCGCGDGASSCCGGNASDVAITNVARLYAGAGTEDLPTTVTDVAFGCGNPTAIAALRPGETVLDLGSGGGIDCFLAARMVGAEGRVYGVDMTPEMIALARQNRAKVGAGNVEFRLGEIEHLPIDANSIDVVISNCVINLAPDKAQVFREAFRVLRPGGRLQVSDIVWTRPAPPEIRDDMEQWAGCIAGALLESDYLAAITAAGFVDVRSDAIAYEGGNGLASASVTAIRPA